MTTQTALHYDWIQQEIAPLFSRSLSRSEAYFAAHSLGRPLDQTAVDMQRCYDLWFDQMDIAWKTWLDEYQTFEHSILDLIGLKGGISPKNSCGQGLRAVLNSFAEPIKVVASRSEFDSLDFILRAFEQKGRVQVQWVEPSQTESGVPVYCADDYLRHCNSDVSLVILSHVYFNTGQVLTDLRRIGEAYQSAGALAVVDSYHAVGVLPVDYSWADFVVGGCYKYLRGGPGACWLAIAERNLSRQTMDTGWFAKKNTFGYERKSDIEYAEGSRGWWESTPGVAAPYQAKAGLELTKRLGVAPTRNYMLALQKEIRERIPGCIVPEDPNAWGQFVLLPHPEADKACEQMRANFGVVADARHGRIRLGADILTTKNDLDRLTEAVRSIR